MYHHVNAGIKSAENGLRLDRIHSGKQPAIKFMPEFHHPRRCWSPIKHLKVAVLEHHYLFAASSRPLPILGVLDYHSRLRYACV